MVDERTQVLVKTKAKEKNKLITAISLIAVSFILLFICKLFPVVADNFFVPLAAIIMAPFKLITGLFPVALLEVLIILAIPIVAFVVRRIIKRYGDLPDKEFYISVGIKLLLFISILLMSYMLLYGLPCRRTPIIKTMYDGVEVTDKNQLYDMTKLLIEKANETRTDYSGYTFDMAYKDLKSAYKIAQRKYDYIGEWGAPSRAKKALFGKPMSYLSITGIFMPFTTEAVVSTNNPNYIVPFAMAHEMAHSKLVSREDEANFIAFLVSLESDVREIRYSAYFNAMIYSLNALYDTDYELYENAWKQMSKEVYGDVINNSKHINKYEGTLSKIGEYVNDAHLKISGQDGIESYDMMVTLLLKWYVA